MQDNIDPDALDFSFCLPGPSYRIQRRLLSCFQVEMALRREGAIQNGNTNGTTHPVALDREDWIELGKLNIGENLQGTDSPVAVQCMSFIATSQPVYNLEIFGEHVYRVGIAGVLCHNTDSEVCTYILKPKSASKVDPDLGDLSDVSPFPKEFDRYEDWISSLNPAVKKMEEFAKKHGLNANSPGARRLLLHLNEKVSDFIAAERQAGILSEFPREFLGMTVGKAIESGNSTVRKLLLDNRWIK